jgi:hypothetical protein
MHLNCAKYDLDSEAPGTHAAIQGR